MSSADSTIPSDFHSRLAIGDVFDCFFHSPQQASDHLPSQWRPASFIDSRPDLASGVDRLLIHFDGLDHQFDEWIDRSSDRIAPFKTRSNAKNEEKPKSINGAKQTEHTQQQQSQPQTQSQPQPQQPPAQNPIPTSIPVSHPISSGSSVSSVPVPVPVSLPVPSESREMFDFRQQLKSGAILDVFNSRLNKWVLAEVTQARNNQLSVVNYTNNESELIDRDSIRIAQPMTKSTDPTATPPRSAAAQTNHQSQPAHQNQQQQQPAQSNPALVPAPAPTHVDLQFTHSLKVGDLADTYDTERIWRLAEVTRADSKSVMIHYCGWSAKWDEVLSRENPRLQPPRSHTSGDTGPPKKPAVVESPGWQPYPSNSFSPSRPNTDCFSQCRWKRVLSTGLGHREIELVDKIFQRCCSIQDEFQDSLLTARALQSDFRARLSELDSDVQALKLANSNSPSKFYLSICSELIQNIRSTMSDDLENQKRMELQSAEEIFMNAIRKQFRIVEIPADGNCLFTALATGIKNRGKFNENQNEEKSRANGQQNSAAADYSSTRVRDEVVSHLVSSALFHVPIQREVLDAISDENANATSKLIVGQLRKLKPECGDIKELAEDPVAISAYESAMKTSGIYGTGLEIESFADLMQIPIEIYYRNSILKGENEVARVEPARIVGENHPGTPIRLAYYMGNKHYNLLLPIEEIKPAANNQVQGENESSHSAEPGNQIAEENENNKLINASNATATAATANISANAAAAASAGLVSSESEFDEQSNSPGVPPSDSSVG